MRVIFGLPSGSVGIMNWPNDGVITAYKHAVGQKW